MPEYSPAPEAEKIGERLVRDVHTRLVDVRIDYVFRDKAAKKHGKEVGGTARKISGLNAFLARDRDEGDIGEDFFVIEIAEDIWRTLTPPQRRALVDHELTHCTFEFDEAKNTVTLGIRGHDIEEFAEVVQRNGIWEDGLAEFAQATKTQLDLFFDSTLAAAS